MVEAALRQVPQEHGVPRPPGNFVARNLCVLVSGSSAVVTGCFLLAFTIPATFGVFGVFGGFSKL